MYESRGLFVHIFIFIDPNKLPKEVWLKPFQYKCNYFLKLFVLSTLIIIIIIVIVVVM